MLDPEQLPIVMERTFKALAEKTGRKLEESFTFDNFSVNDEAEFEIDLISGWLNSLTYKRITKVDGTSKEEGYSIKRLRDKTPAF